MPKNTCRLIMTLTVASAMGASAQTVDNRGPITGASVGTTIPTTPAEGRRQAPPGETVEQLIMGRSFFGEGPRDGTVFALTQTALTVTRADGKHVVTADESTDADGATLKVISTLYDVFELQIPQLSISAVIKGPQLGQSDTSYSYRLSTGEYVKFTTYDDGLIYANLGQWGVSPTKYGQDTNTAYFMFGFQTAPAGMPRRGEATYSGVNDVNGTVFIQGGEIGELHGSGSLTADFGKNTVTGVLSDITVTPASGGATLPWDTVSLLGTISGDLISGKASVVQSPGNSLSLATSGKGSLSGGFYGPAADDVALIWTLHDAKGSNAVGTFGAPGPCLCLQAR